MISVIYEDVISVNYEDVISVNYEDVISVNYEDVISVNYEEFFPLTLLPRAKRSVGNKDSGLEKIVVDMLGPKIKAKLR